MATGCSDGSLKLWRSNPSKPSTLHMPWELVGVFVAHEGPVKGICLTDCGQKIATFCNKSGSDASSTIHIWDAVNLISAGTFILEDKLTLESPVITFNWLTLGNGQLLVGVCLQNELQIYAQRHYDGLTFSNSVNFSKMNIWVCIAFAHSSLLICDFLWGSRATAVVIHGNCFSIFSHWLFHVDTKRWNNFNHCDSTENCKGERYEDVLSAVFIDCDLGSFRELSTRDNSSDWDSMQSIKINMKDNNLSSSLILAKEQLKSELGTNVGLWNILEIAEMINGSLPTYHPDVLLANISSGSWKRTYVAVRHLVGCLSSNYETEGRHVSKTTGLPDLELSYYMDGLISKSSQDKGFQWTGVAASISSISLAQSGSNQSPYQSGSRDEIMSISASAKSELNGFIESIQNFPELSAVANIEKTQILAIIDLLSEVSSTYSSSAYQSLDEPGRSYLYLFYSSIFLFEK